MDHEYPLMVPLCAEPEPAKLTDCPSAIVMSAAGLVIAPDGGISVGAAETWTNLATEGTPELLIRKII